jgi:FAD/FMN-containing dehydrogenase
MISAPALTEYPTEPSSLKEWLIDIVGIDGVRDDPASLAMHSEDIWSASDRQCDLIVSPTTLDQLAAVVGKITQFGAALAPRGGGMSYTSGYIPTIAGTVSLDLSRMDRILEINADDMTVTVEAGCTWAKLDEALKQKGLRTPFWGPRSGLKSTIGGGLSQLNAMFGAGHYGTSSESVVGLTMVLDNGSILRTGAAGIGPYPFYRHYGPDLTGLFCGDCGTLGIKGEITLRLIRRPAFEDYASFSFATGADLLNAMAEMARAGIACEMCAFDPGLTKVRLKRASLATDLKTLGAVVAKESSVTKGLMSAAKVVLGGRSFVGTDDYPLHIIAEGRNAAAVAGDMAEARRIATAFKGREIENSIAKIIRAMPFPPLNSMLGPEGEAWVPVHGMVALSQGAALFEAIQALFAEMADEFKREHIEIGFLFTSVSTNP